MFPEMILAEFNGSLHEVVVKLGFLVRGFHRTYPPAKDLWWESSEAMAEYLKLSDQLNEQAPEGHYFGGHPLHPQCLGFWPKF